MVQNQELFRHSNERLHERIAAIAQDGQRIPFLCECADGGCTGRVNITLEEYGDVRDDRAHYLIVPGHLTIEGEDVVSKNDRYAVVEKPAA